VFGLASSVAINEKNCLSVQAPDLAGTFRILFVENSGLTDTIQVLVEQSYIQMGDYTHTIFVVDSAEIKANPEVIFVTDPGHYENRSYSQPLIVDKTKFTMGDAQYYFKIGNIETIAYPSFDEPYFHSLAESINKYRQEPYKDENLEGSKLPLVNHGDFAWRLANERSKKEGLDTAYYKTVSGGIELDTSASGYRLPSGEEWYFLMRAGASTTFFLGNEVGRTKEDSLKISRYAWIYLGNVEKELKPVAQLLPNGFGLYDVVDIVPEYCDSSPASFFICKMLLGGGTYYNSFRLLRKTPKLHKLDKF